MHCSGLRAVHAEQKRMNAPDFDDDVDEVSEQNNAGRSMRKSAAKAKNRFKQLETNDERAEDVSAHNS